MLFVFQPSKCELAAMEGMVACMLFYPRACGSLKDKLGAYFLSKMDSNNMKTQEVRTPSVSVRLLFVQLFMNCCCFFLVCRWPACVTAICPAWGGFWTEP